MSAKENSPQLFVLDGGLQIDPDATYIEKIFGEDGYLSKIMSGYRPRPGQLAMARAIDSAIRENRHVIIEGPTGTGKSLAYAAPAVFHAVHHGLSIGIVTANKNLQRQIYEKDLADLQRAVPWPFKYAIRKGLSSYLCVRNFESGDYHDIQGSLFKDDEESKMLQRTIEWAETTDTGDFEESPGPGYVIWSKFSTERDECDGRRCNFYDDCFVRKAKEKAQGAHVTVTNYHLFYTQLMNPSGKILPQFDVVIFDEAHRVADIARNFFGDQIRWGSLYRVFAGLSQIDTRGFKTKAKKLKERGLGVARALWTEMGRMVKTRKRILDAGDLPTKDLQEVLAEVSSFYVQAADALFGVRLYCYGCETQNELEKVRSLRIHKDEAVWSCSKCYRENTESIGRVPPDVAAEYERCRKMASRALELEDLLAQFHDCPGQGQVYFIEGSGDLKKMVPNVSLKSSAVEVGGFLRKAAFEVYPTIVQTSATLAIRGGGKSDFDHQRREVGMTGMENVAELTVESPFNWKERAMLVIPRTMPEYAFNNKDWDQAVLEHFERTINMVRGRTLGLFTSRRMLEMTRDHLRTHTDWRVLCQYERTNRQLAEEFQRDVSSVLLGTSSFAEGISIEGESCACVVLDKIPFVNKDDPVVVGIERMLKEQRRKENVFQSHMLPTAIIDFKQRVGRLIRTVKDVGVVVCLDRRLLTKNYRFQFINSLPPLRVVESLDEIGPFMRRVGGLA